MEGLDGLVKSEICHSCPEQVLARPERTDFILSGPVQCFCGSILGFIELSMPGQAAHEMSEGDILRGNMSGQKRPTRENTRHGRAYGRAQARLERVRARPEKAHDWLQRVHSNLDNI